MKNTNRAIAEFRAAQSVYGGRKPARRRMSMSMEFIWRERQWPVGYEEWVPIMGWTPYERPVAQWVRVDMGGRKEIPAAKDIMLRVYLRTRT